MRSAGIIVEYNPFHNGHIYHIKETRRLTDPDVLVAVMSGNYNQRGDISILNKFDKTAAALSHGVDLILELPYIYTVQNAYVFASKAIELLARMHVNDVVFGSETNNLAELIRYSEMEIDITRLKELMHDGNSFPKSYGLLSSFLYPNDMLAVAYLKTLKDYPFITPHCIQRTNDYLSTDINVISSATAIRQAIRDGKDVSAAMPIQIEEPVFNSDLYPYLRRLLFTMTREELKQIFLVSEGIEALLKDNAILYDSYEEFIRHSVSRRYTRSRIQRICLHIMNRIRKKEVEQLPKNAYVRVLGFNEKGRALLKELKEEVNIVTQFKHIPEPYKQMEWKTSLVYASLLKDPQSYIRKELKGPIIY